MIICTFNFVKYYKINGFMHVLSFSLLRSIIEYILVFNFQNNFFKKLAIISKCILTGELK